MPDINISVEPSKSLIDEKVQIRVLGLMLAENVTVSGCVTEGDMKFGSYAWYQADNNGVIDLNKMASVGGSYRGIEPMGLFWSMQQTSGQRAGLRLVKRDVTTPLFTTVSVFKGHVNPFELTFKQDFIAEKVTERWYMSDNVKRFEVSEGRLKGALFVPQGGGPYSGLIDVCGTGGRMESRAALLANKGYTVFHLVHVGEGSLPKTWCTIDMDYFDEAFDFMERQASVQTNNIGMTGNSMGGELSMLFASLSTRVKAVAVTGAVPYVTHDSHEYKAKGITLQAIECDFDKVKHGNNNDMIFGYTVSTKIPEARIKLENYEAPILLIQLSEDTAVIPTAEEDVASIEKEFGPTTTKVITYEGAGHLLQPPYQPFCYSSYLKAINVVVAWGGQMVEHVRAKEDSWKVMLEFLFRHMSPDPKSRI